ncbi:MAG: hypothetical protein AAGE96_11985 [Cyanobacteria bacterium P01_G01_bin.19]
MISRDAIAKEYINVINNYYPVASNLLSRCLVRVLELTADRTKHRSYYLCIYYLEKYGDRLLGHQDIFRDAAENMGLVEVIFISIDRLVKDPHSKIKQEDFRFWLELCWLASNQ